MVRRVLVGTVTLERDTVMYNLEFQYAASFEQLKIAKGEYPIYAREDDLITRNGETELRTGYIGYEGIVLAGNVGNKPGERSKYHPYIRGYELADRFVNGYGYYNKIDRADYALRPEWGIKLDDYVSSIDGRRKFSHDIVLTDPEGLTLAE